MYINKYKPKQQWTKLFAKLNIQFKSKMLSELEIGIKYKANNFQFDTRYWKKISNTLDNKFNVFLPER